MLFLHSTTDLLTFVACGSSFVIMYLWNNVKVFLLALAMTKTSVLTSTAGGLEGTRILSKSQNEAEIVGTVRERGVGSSSCGTLFFFLVCYCSGQGIVGK